MKRRGDVLADAAPKSSVGRACPGGAVRAPPAYPRRGRSTCLPPLLPVVDPLPAILAQLAPVLRPLSGGRKRVLPDEREEPFEERTLPGLRAGHPPTNVRLERPELREDLPFLHEPGLRGRHVPRVVAEIPSIVAQVRRSSRRSRAASSRSRGLP